MTKALLLFAFFLAAGFSFAQDRQRYDTVAAEAEDLFLRKEFLRAARKYMEAFAALDGKAVMRDRFNAACAWAMADRSDSAFIHLNRLADVGKFSDTDHLLTESYLESLHADERWALLVETVRANREKEEALYDRPLKAELDSIYEKDQRYRQQLGEIEQRYGRESTEVEAHWRLIAATDSVNLVRVRQILDTRGWLGPDVVGAQGSSALFLVIQHADQATQEIYLPMMREAVAKGNAAPSQLALLEDRVALGQGKKQLYGSQIGRNAGTGEFYVQPLEDPDNVDIRRAEMGLGPLSEYTKLWSFSWDPETYKRQLPGIEAAEKKQRKERAKQEKKAARQR